MTQQPSVLYVEDDPHSRKLMQKLLQGRMGLTNVTILENSEDFLIKAESLLPKPDIIFLDIHMKPYDGFDMLEILNKLEWARDIPVVALTASVMNEEVQRLKSSGFDGCLAKPIELNRFPETFDRLMRGETVWRISGC